MSTGMFRTETFTPPVSQLDMAIQKKGWRGQGGQRVTWIGEGTEEEEKVYGGSGGSSGDGSGLSAHDSVNRLIENVFRSARTTMENEQTYTHGQGTGTLSANDIIEPLLIEMRRLGTPKPKPHAITLSLIVAIGAALIPLYIYALSSAEDRGALKNQVAEISARVKAVEAGNSTLGELKAQMSAMQQDQKYVRDGLDELLRERRGK